MIERKREEAEIVEGIITCLTLKGYIVLRVNQWRADKAGGDVVPDLIVTHPKWGEGEAILAEVKTEQGKLSKRRPSHRTELGYSQQDLFDMGRMFVWRNLYQAEADIVRYERRRNMERKDA